MLAIALQIMFVISSHYPIYICNSQSCSYCKLLNRIKWKSKIKEKRKNTAFKTAFANENKEIGEYAIYFLK